MSDSREAQTTANEGNLVLAVFANPDAERSGHVAVVRPSEKSMEALCETDLRSFRRERTIAPALSSGSDSRTIPVHFPMEFYFVRTPFEIVNNRSHGHERVK